MNRLHCLIVANLLLLQVDFSSSFSPVLSTDPKIAVPLTSPCTSSSCSTSPWRNNRMKATDRDRFEEEYSPSNDSMTELQRRISRQQNQYAELLLEQSEYEGGERPVPESVHIILFHPGTEKQHVHTVEFPQGSGTYLILAFEGGSDCAEFARMLRDLEIADPSPEETMFEPFAHYCDMTGLSLMVVPKGFQLTPPQINANDINEEEDADDNEVIAPINENVVAIDVDDDLDSWG